MAVIRASDIAEYLAGRAAVYDGAFAADVARLRKTFGASTVVEALRLVAELHNRDGFSQITRDTVAKSLPEPP